MGSANLMIRNTVKRIESALEILGQKVSQTIHRRLMLMLSDEVSLYQQCKNQYEYYSGKIDGQMAHYTLPILRTHQVSSFKRQSELMMDRFSQFIKRK